MFCRAAPLTKWTETLYSVRQDVYDQTKQINHGGANFSQTHNIISVLVPDEFNVIIMQDMGWCGPQWTYLIVPADFTPLAVPGVCKSDPEWFIPPYNGFGSEEDSLGYCFNLMPKPPQRDFVKFMAHDRRGFDGNVLRFLARLDTDVSVDVDRRFIVSYFRTDDTILIHEPPVENSGRSIYSNFYFFYNCIRVQR